MSDARPFTDTRRGKKLSLEDRISDIEARLREGDERMMRIELAAERMSGSVDMLPGMIDSKFDSFIQLLKTRDAIIAASRSGHDVDSKTPARSELKWGGASLRLPPTFLVFAFISTAVFITSIAGCCYLVVRHWEAPARTVQTIGAK